MIPPDCPSSETLAALPSLEEAERDAVCAHLAACDGCRRETSLLAIAEAGPLPPARLDPERLAARVRRRRLLPALSAAAALLVLLPALLLRPPAQPPAAPPAVDVSPPSVAKEPDRPPASIPAVPAPPQPPRTPPAPEAKEVPPTVDAPLAPPPGPLRPAPAPDGLERAVSLVAQAVPVLPLAGSVSLRGGRLTGELYAGPSDVLSSPEGAQIRVMEQLAVHLSPGAELSVSWSQTLDCPSLSPRKGESLVEVGPTPRALHLSAEGLGLRLEEASGDLLLAVESGELRATPISAPARLRRRDGRSVLLPPGMSVRLGTSGESFAPGPSLPDERFPTRRRPAGPGAAPPAPSPAPPDPLEALRSLGTSGYRYAAEGRRLRTGAYRDGLLSSATGDFLALRPLGEPAATHLRRGSRPWNQPGVLRGEDERIAAALRVAQAPHVQLLLALQGVRGEPQVRAEKVLNVEAWVFRWDFDPLRVRSEMEGLLERAADEERFDKPREVHWGTLEGALEIAVARDAPRVLRAADLRRVAYQPAAPTASRTWYRAEVVTSFFDHGRAAPPPLPK